MSVEEQALIAAALAVRAMAHAPYSAFAVGAAIASTDGRHFTGCNVENASFGLTVCAERNALAAAIASGAKQFHTIVVATRGGVAPCGACRQVLSEFCAELHVVRVDELGQVVARDNLSALLPGRFGAQQL
jgi:cytidine deaminase